MSGDERFIEELVNAVPDIAARYEAHLRDYDTLLPHVFMGDVTRFVVEQIQRGAVAGLHPVFRQFERGLTSGDADVGELIVASFVENLKGEEGEVRKVLPLMPATLLRAVRDVLGI